MAGELKERERTVLHYVVRDFIETATPIGSRYISRRHEDVLGLSSASIRNVMSDLEYLGYINHPHTSAGRVPTDVGYRFYLDSLMRMDAISATEQKAIRQNLNSTEEEDELLKESSQAHGEDLAPALRHHLPPAFRAARSSALSWCRLAGPASWSSFRSSPGS